MRQVKWTDRHGWNHLSLVRDGDPDEMAESGLLRDPPDVNGIDWEVVKRELHNRLVDAGLVTWADVQRGQKAVTGIVSAVLRRRVIGLYRLDDRQEAVNGG